MTYKKETVLQLGRTIRTMLRYNFIFFFIFFALFMQISSANAYTNGKVTFQWQANSPNENVAGYRLYYGSSSRYDANGKPKSSFVYDYYIDLDESVRCNNLSYNNDCEYLPRNELSCTGLNSSAPQCTLYDLKGTLHLAMTAYNTLEESNYTSEIKVAPGNSKSRGSKALPAIRMLLLSGTAS